MSNHYLEWIDCKYNECFLETTNTFESHEQAARLYNPRKESIIIYDFNVNNTVMIVYLVPMKSPLVWRQMHCSVSGCMLFRFHYCWYFFFFFFFVSVRRYSFARLSKNGSEKWKASKSVRSIVVCIPRTNAISESSVGEKFSNKTVAPNQFACELKMSSTPAIIKITHFVNPHKFFFKWQENEGKSIVNSFEIE